MKKVSSAVWKFFDRIEQNNRCVSVLCKLCDSQYKYFGNTTNLRVHLINKHPIQWELSESGTLDESSFRIEDAVTVASNSKPTPSPKKRKYTRRKTSADKNVGYFVSVNTSEEKTKGVIPHIEMKRVDQTDSEQNEEDEATMNLVRQMHGEQQSDEEWLEEDPYQITHIETYEPKPKHKRKTYRKIKREVPSPNGLPGFYAAPKPEKIVYETPNRTDEYSIFGEYIANKLRKIKTPRTRGNLQQLITTILWQAEYGMYDSAETVKRVLLMTNQVEPEHTIEFEHHVVQQNEDVEIQNDEREEIDSSRSRKGSVSVL